MINREAHVEGVLNDVDEVPSLWPKITATDLVMLKDNIEKLILQKTSVRVNLADAEVAELYYSSTSNSGFPEVLERDGKGFCLVPIYGNAYTYVKHSRGVNYNARMYRRGAEFITVSKFNGDFFEVQDSLNRIRVSDKKLLPLL
jgi:hypothetical protein